MPLDCISHWVRCLSDIETALLPSLCGSHNILERKIKQILNQSVSLMKSTSRYSLLHRILAGQSTSGKLGGQEVKTSARVSRWSLVRIPPESPVKFFPQTLGKHWVYSAIHTSVWGKLNQLFITRRKNFINYTDDIHIHQSWFGLSLLHIQPSRHWQTRPPQNHYTHYW